MPSPEGSGQPVCVAQPLRAASRASAGLKACATICNPEHDAQEAAVGARESHEQALTRTARELAATKVVERGHAAEEKQRLERRAEIHRERCREEHDGVECAVFADRVARERQK